jgi:hypothetical protein
MHGIQNNYGSNKSVQRKKGSRSRWKLNCKLLSCAMNQTMKIPD